MNPLKRLAGQTAIYGLSSIIGRLLNYLLVPMYTRVFTTGEFGVVTELYSYVAFLIVILLYGMETAFFRFSETHPSKKVVYNTSLLSVITSSFIFVFLASLFSHNIADTLHYPDHNEYVIWLAMIVSMDAITSLPFAKLRLENKAKRFATIKLINIGVNIGLNLFLILGCPYLMKNDFGAITSFVSTFHDGRPHVGHVFIANLIASGITLLLLVPEILKISFQTDKALYRKMLIYALPLMIAGLAGIVNETLDRILLKYMLEVNAMSQLGIYGACYKVSLIMTITIQAFRYAAEPFFFSNANRKDARELYAKVMKFFVIFLSIVFLGIMLYIDIVIKFVGEDFRSGVDVVPILLLANLFLGIYYNLSVWYKITEKTIFGAGFALVGASITIVLNILLIPQIGYMGSAWATLACYVSMTILSFIFMRKHFPIPYPIVRIIFYLLSALVLYYLGDQLLPELYPRQILLKYVVNAFLFVAYIIFIYKLEKNDLRSLRQKS